MKEFTKKTIEKPAEKTKVTSFEIIVTGTIEKPYFESKYKEVGKENYNIGYSSCNLNTVFGWRDECFEIVKRPKGENERKQTRIESICSMSVEELAEKIFESEVSTMLDFCQEFSKCNELIEKGEEIPDEMCKKCLVKWLNSVEQKKTIPKEHFEERFNRVN